MSTVDAIPDDAGIQRVISLIDLTDLDDAHRPDGIAALLVDAARHGTAAVCVWPEFVRRAAAELVGSDVRVATVVNFPDGASSTKDVSTEIVASLEAGADEIDVVLPWRAFLGGDIANATNVVRRAAELVHESPGALLKVILETGELPSPASIADASQLAIDCGADFIKTSTGKTQSGASVEAVAVMLDAIARNGGGVGIKPSGGVRTLADALSYLDLAAERLGDSWATPRTFRFGASGLLGNAVGALSQP